MEDLPTPQYTLEETRTSVILSVWAPLCRPSDVNVYLEKKILTFEAHPYFLKLKLPCDVSEETTEDYYDELKGMYSLKLMKITGIEDERHSDNKCEDILKCFVPQSNSDICNHDCAETPSYGFLNLYSRKFGQYFREFSQVIDLPDPDNTKMADRTCLREKEEKEKWNDDHYLADQMEDDHIIPLLNYVPPWDEKKINELSKEEIEILKSISKCDCLETGLPDDKIKLAELQMVDVLLGYCYNKRTTEGENTVESAWTINKLSSSLCWLEVFRDLKSVLLSFYRRSLTYPLYRNWKLTKLIHKDVVQLLKSGSCGITRCFIEMKELFDMSENRYILNTLYVNLLCHFSLSLTQDRLDELAEEVKRIKIEKPEVQEDLIFLEMAAKMVLEDENETTDKEDQMTEIMRKVASLKFDEGENSSSYESHSDDSTSSSSSSSE